MKSVKVLHKGVIRLLGLCALASLWITPRAGAALEQTFSVLQIGTTTYRNVTVTTKTKDYIFLLHSAGMTNVKVRDIPGDVRVKLGYEDPSAPKVSTNGPALWAKQTLSKIETPQVKRVGDQVSTWLVSVKSNPRLIAPQIDQQMFFIVLAALLGLYLFHSYCCMLICQKAGAKPGALVWVPLLQLIPLLKAAHMSPWWVLGFLVPGFNLFVQILWCVRITQARGKAFWVALLLIFPLTSPFAVLHLAFSGGRRAKRSERRIEIMTLEAA